ncbi:MAG: VanZ family protein [Pyrinomonadaceae bacterium]
MSSRTTAPFAKSRHAHTTGSRLWRYGPLVVWGVLIFLGSGNVLSATHTSVLLRAIRWLFPNVRDESLAVFHLLVRKAGHLTEYAILATLAARALQGSARDFLRRHWFWLSLLLAIAYALTDEFHQSFVPSRTASIYDCLIDSVGALIGLTVIWSRRRKPQPDSARAGRAEPGFLNID